MEAMFVRKERLFDLDRQDRPGLTKRDHHLNHSSHVNIQCSNVQRSTTAFQGVGTVLDRQWQ